MNLVLIGLQGSGKGTQAELLAKKFKLAVISVGELYRTEIRKKTELGKRAGKYVLKGVLVPDEMTESLLKAALKKSKYKKGVIFDGFPRNVKQIKFLERLAKVDYVILINLSQKEAIKRLGGRRVCENCGEIYHVLIKRPKKDMLCDVCGGKLKRRADDYSLAIKKRLKIYQQKTGPIINYFKKQNKLIKINGQKSVKQVFQEILAQLKNKGIK